MRAALASPRWQRRPDARPQELLEAALDRGLAAVEGVLAALEHAAGRSVAAPGL